MSKKKPEAFPTIKLDLPGFGRKKTSPPMADLKLEKRGAVYYFRVKDENNKNLTLRLDKSLDKAQSMAKEIKAEINQKRAFKKQWQKLPESKIRESIESISSEILGINISLNPYANTPPETITMWKNAWKREQQALEEKKSGNKMTLNQLSERVFKSKVNDGHSKTTTRTQKSTLDKLIKSTGKTRVYQLTETVLQEYFDGISSEMEPSSVYQNFIVLKGLFNRAIKNKWIKTNPMVGVIVKKTINKRAVTLTHEEIDTILSTPQRSKHVERFLYIATYTGMRLNEVLHLKWENVDFNKGIIFVENTEDFRTKNKQNRTVPLLKELREYLDGQQSTGIIIPLVDDSIGDAIRTLSKKIGIKFTPHVLRHTFCSLMIEAGQPIEKISKWLGHKDINVTFATYMHLIPNAEEISIKRKPSS